MKAYFIPILSTLLCLSSVAKADFYGSFGLGVAFNNGSSTTKDLRSSYDDSAAYSFAVGYQLPLLLTDVRVEGEYGEIFDVKTGKKVKSYYKNGYTTVKLPEINGYCMLYLPFKK